MSGAILFKKKQPTSSGHPMFAKGTRADENHVSRTSSSCRTTRTSSSAHPNATAALLTAPDSAPHSEGNHRSPPPRWEHRKTGMRWPHLKGFQRGDYSTAKLTRDLRSRRFLIASTSSGFFPTKLRIGLPQLPGDAPVPDVFQPVPEDPGLGGRVEGQAALLRRLQGLGCHVPATGQEYDKNTN